jgi:hypothetical protein
MKNITWLAYLNFIILQWFFIRISRTGEIKDDRFIQTGWGLVKFVLPLTGWWSNYIYIGTK